ncbi:amino acid antiporter [Legionella busanensis]|uniref:Amino acid antiporter n=1 Tax=Legionella busanensis TaxID=190655 RepID=A0A378JL70_9GAMM|nr:APC family permease [Legionella busanensis]STX51481.1 amino acid antiporter [Legionella busanensis]
MLKKLSSLQLTLIIVCSVDSIRNLPAAATMGRDLFFYFLLAFLFFLLPCAVITSWFTQQSDEGIYGWVKLSLGKGFGFVAIWLQFMQNLFIFPTFLAFIAGLFLYCFDGSLAQNNHLIFLITNSLIWGLTWINRRGFSLSSFLTICCSFVGLIIPFILILAIGIEWLIINPHTLTTLTSNTENSWAALTAIILSFCGIEIAAIHAKESKANALPRAIGFSTFIIFFTMLFGALTLALIIPSQQLSFITGIPDLFQIFFSQIKLDKIALIIDMMVFIGCVGCANNWLISPIKGLTFAFKKEGNAVHTDNVNNQLLVIQASIISIISILFLFFPSVNMSYWLMIVLATQMYLVMYVLMFLSAICLALQQQKTNKWWVITLGLLGIGGSLIAFSVSFYPPTNLATSQLNYCLLLLLSLVIIAMITLASYTILNQKFFKLASQV